MELPKVKGKYLSIPMVTVLAVLGIALQFGCNWAYHDHKSIVERVGSLEASEQRMAAATQQRSDLGNYRYQELNTAIGNLKEQIEEVKKSQLRAEGKLDSLIASMITPRTASAVGP